MTPDLREGQTFGAYRLIRVVGSGGMGVVYQAEQHPLRRIVALKVIRPEIAQSGDYRARFLREARLAAAVEHPHIVPVHDFGEYAGRLYLTMQWIDGVELERLVDGQVRMDPARAVRIGVQVASALDAIHRVGMLHRDVKPANIMVRDVDGEDHAYLTDFGIAKVIEAQDGLTRTGLMVGTSGYLSPEQIRGQKPDARSDLYALGCVVFMALTGQRPFAGLSGQELLWAHVSSPRPVASETCPGLGRRYDDFLTRALAPDPRDRFQTGHEFGAALEAAHARQQAIRSPTYVRPSPEQLPPTRTSRPGGGPKARPPAARAAGRPDSAGAAMMAAAGTKTAGPVTPAAVRGPLRPGPSHPGRPARGYAARVVAALGCVLFLVSVTVLHNYANYGTGWKSLWAATHGEMASPLYAKDFWISAALAAFVLMGTAATIGMRGRSPAVVMTVAALGLVGYTLYIPAIGATPGFSPFGAGYWISLGAAAVMTLGMGAAAIWSGQRGP